MLYLQIILRMFCVRNWLREDKDMKKIMVIAPSKSLSVISNDTKKNAINKLNSIGYEVIFSKNVYKNQLYYCCGSVDDRVEDLNEAFSSNVDVILSAIGGYNSNQLLPYIDYNLIKNNPKIICGFSDVTAILVAIYAKTGIITYYGPHFSSFGMIYGIDYTVNYFLKAINGESIIIESSQYYRDDPWYMNQSEVNKIKNYGLKIINKGVAEGVILGGNLNTLNLLQGTEYMPHLEKIILFIEDSGGEDGNFLLEFDRNLESLLQSEIGSSIKGIVIGICQNVSNMNVKKWKLLVKNKKMLNKIPILVDANFGHTTPIFTFPIGGYARIEAFNVPKIIIGRSENEL